MNHCDHSTPDKETALTFNLGTFEGFNFRHHCAVERILTANEVVGWDHDREGEAEFWPSGDHPGAALIFRNQQAVTGSEIVALDDLLEQLSGDSDRSFLRIHYAMVVHGCAVADITLNQLDDEALQIFVGSNFTDLRREAAYELFELCYPEAYAVWEKSTCDGLIFDTDRFLDSPSWSVLEVEMGDRKALIVAPC